MKNNNGNKLIFWIIVLAIIGVLIYFYFNSEPAEVKLAKCIGSKSILYVQKGCSACAAQQKLFGDSYEYLNIIDCKITPELCAGITSTPTWIINNEKISGVQSIEKLKQLAGC